MSQDLLSNIILGATKPFRTGANILAQNYGSAFTGKDMSQKENQGLFLQYLASALTPEEQETIREKPYLSAVKSGAGMAATLAPFGANSLRAMQYTANPLANRLLQLGSQGALEGGMGGFGLSREGKEVQDTLTGAGVGVAGEIASDYLFNPQFRQMLKKTSGVDESGSGRLFHVSDRPDLKIDRNYEPKRGQMGKGFYATNEPEVWQSGQIGNRPYVYEVDTNNLNIAKEFPTQKELIDWGSKNGYFKYEPLKRPSGEIVRGPDGSVIKSWVETPKAQKFMKYQDPMTGETMSGLQHEYLKAKGYDGAAASYSPDGQQIVIFNYDKIKLIPTWGK